MTDQQLIEKYNPATAASLTPEDLEAMRALTDAQITVLAKAYPNQPRHNSYLRLYDTRVPAEKQIYQRSTWQNLNNVRKFSNAKYLVPFDFLLTGNKQQNLRPVPGGKTIAAPQRVSVDLSAQEAAEELRKSLTADKPNVDNEQQAGEQAKTQKPGKAATGKASTGTKAKAKPAENVVENDTLPDDQQFTTVE